LFSSPFAAAGPARGIKSKVDQMPTILVVDDVATDRVRIAGLAARWNNSTVLQATSGQQALELIEQHQPDIVLTDLNMEGMDGLQLVQKVKQEFPYIPVVLMTAEGSEQIAAQALQVGATSYLPKKDLAQELNRVLRQVHITARDAHIQTDVMHQIQTAAIELHVFNDRGVIRSTVGLLVNLLKCLPLGDETERLRTGIAVEEALLNACCHGNLEIGKAPDAGERDFEALMADRMSDPAFARRKIYVRAEIDRNQATFVIRDEGAGFDPSRFLKPHGERLDLRHRGIQLMRTIMDDVRYNGRGNEVTMVGRRHDPPPMDDAD
jgi:CheY-like chemotaxis protein/anti-sigma regulatory factor (Ser/Thr protein kinase)